MINLYIDHQNVAPLIYSLEDILDKAVEQSHNAIHKHELRRPLYEAFADILYALHPQSQQSYQPNEGVVKLEDGLLTSPDGDLIEGGHLQNSPEEQLALLNKESVHKERIGTRGRKQMEVELALMGWMMAEDKKVFEKKEIVEKYNELWESEKKMLPMDKLMKMLEKYKMWNVIIRDRKGFQHFLRYDMNSSIATVVKREEVSLEISREEPIREKSMVGIVCGNLPVVPEKEEEQSEQKVNLYTSAPEYEDNLFAGVNL